MMWPVKVMRTERCNEANQENCIRKKSLITRPAEINKACKNVASYLVGIGFSLINTTIDCFPPLAVVTLTPSTVAPSQ